MTREYTDFRKNHAQMQDKHTAIVGYLSEYGFVGISVCLKSNSHEEGTVHVGKCVRIADVRI